MKRTNPDTDREFERGFVDNETGLIFYRYRSNLKADGFYGEEWVTKEAWQRKYKPGRKIANQRLNPNTAAPFKRGDVDNKGRIFRQYDFTRVLDNGNYVEVWAKDAESFERSRLSGLKSQKKKNQNLKNQGRLVLKRRLCPNTKNTFKKGDNFNGKYFIRYDLRMENPEFEGYYQEIWANKKSWEKYRKNERTPTRLATVLCNHAKQRAKKFGGKFTLIKSEIAERIEKGACEVTGMPFVLEIPKSNQPQPFSPSLDRIDNENRDYSQENVRVVISAFNNMRGALDEKTLKKVITAYLINNPD